MTSKMAVRYKFIHFNTRSGFDSTVPNPELNSAQGNEYYNYVVFIKETKEIYTHGEFYNCSDSGDPNLDKLIEELRNSINLKADLASFNELIAEVEENEEVAAAALTELHKNKVDKSELPDFGDFVSKNDLNIVIEDKPSRSSFKTVNGEYILIEGNDTNIETPDTKVTSVENHYKQDGATAHTTTGFATNVIYDAAGHITGLTARSITESDIPEIDASKISKGTISIDRLPAGALERMFVVESETAAMSTTVQEGDVVQVTGNNNKMYFCVSNIATTFSAKFKEFTAGTATSVSWSGIISKPEGIDNWGNRISAIEGTYATQDWVGDKYLSKSGGSVSSDDYQPLIVNSNFSSGVEDVRIAISHNCNVKGLFNWESNGVGLRMYNAICRSAIGIKDDGTPYYDSYELIHSGNIGLSNAGSATKLQTPRSIWGQSFDGQSDVSGNISVSCPYINTDPRLGSLDSIGASSITYQSGFGLYCWIRNTGNAHLQVGDDSRIGTSLAYNMVLQPLGGNVAIGSTTAEEKLHVHGNVKANNFIGNLTGNADYAMNLSCIPTNQGIDLNNLSYPTVWFYGQSVEKKNFPSGFLYGGVLNIITSGRSLNGQLAWDVTHDSTTAPTNRLWWRASNNIGFCHDWHEIVFKDVLNNYLPLSGGTLTSSGVTTLTLKDTARNESAIAYYGNSGTQWFVGKGVGSIGDDFGFYNGENGVVLRLNAAGSLTSIYQMYATDFCTTSDARLKDFTNDVEIDFENLKNIPKKYYYWKDKSMGENLQIGTSAQELIKVYPSCVYYNEEDDKYSVNYQKLSVVALAAIDKLHDRVKYLESKIND